MRELTPDQRYKVERFCVAGRCGKIGKDLVCTATSGTRERRLEGQVFRVKMNFCHLTLGEANCGTTGYDL